MECRIHWNTYFNPFVTFLRRTVWSGQVSKMVKN